MKATINLALNVLLVSVGIWVAKAHPAVGAIGGIVFSAICAFCVQIAVKKGLNPLRAKVLMGFYALVSVGSIINLM